jgi:cytochrome b pre-mRNA-processing protein 3
MKTFADAFYGRLEAYEAAADAAAMADALVRNLYRGNATPAAAIVANYVMRAEEHLNTTGEGDVDFGPLPGEDQA